MGMYDPSRQAGRDARLWRGAVEGGTRPERDQTCEAWVRMTTAPTSAGRV